MRKIINPFTHIEGYNCFGCSPENKLGLHLEFFEDGEYVISNWEPKPHLNGYGNVLHGGIQATILDEIASWLIYVKVKTAGVTAELNIRYKSTVYTNKGTIKVRAKLKEQNKKFAIVFTEIIDTEGNVCSEADVKYFLFPEEIAKRRLFYPGYDAFFEHK